MVHRNTPPAALPRLPAPPSHERLRASTPLDLRSARYAKLPGSTSSFGSYATDDDEPHPLPCYSADEETFAPVTEMPWVTEKKERMKRRNKEWDRNPQIADAAVNDLINETLDEEIAALAQWVLDDEQNEADADQELEGIADEEFLDPVIADEAFVVVWTLLYDLARETTPQQLAQMKETQKGLTMDEKTRKALANHILEGQDWFQEMQEEESLQKTPWHALVYNYSRKLHSDSLTYNVALNMLQETVATGAALAELVSSGLLTASEDDLAALDELERAVNPPRQG